MSAPAPLRRVDAAAVDALLPQTQCGKCGHDGCAPYARAIADGAANINRCPPGGAAGIRRLAALTGLPELPLDPACGTETPRCVARIDPASCIGCTLCIQACPVDAIIGAGRRLHAVIAALCTGCELCVAPCPVDCITMDPLDAPALWTDADAAAAGERHRRRTRRLAAAEPDVAPAPDDAAERRRRTVQSAIAAARARLAGRTDRSPFR